MCVLLGTWPCRPPRSSPPPAGRACRSGARRVGGFAGLGLSVAHGSSAECGDDRRTVEPVLDELLAGGTRELRVVEGDREPAEVAKREDRSVGEGLDERRRHQDYVGVGDILGTRAERFAWRDDCRDQLDWQWRPILVRVHPVVVRVRLADVVGWQDCIGLVQRLGFEEDPVTVLVTPGDIGARWTVVVAPYLETERFP